MKRGLKRLSVLSLLLVSCMLLTTFAGAKEWEKQTLTNVGVEISLPKEMQCVTMGPPNLDYWILMYHSQEVGYSIEVWSGEKNPFASNGGQEVSFGGVQFQKSSRTSTVEQSKCYTVEYVAKVDGVHYGISFQKNGADFTTTELSEIEKIMGSIRILGRSAAVFSDLAGHWAEREVEKAVEYGVFSGSGDCFRPNETMTRAMLAQSLCAVVGNTDDDPEWLPFTDVPADAWYADAANQMGWRGIIQGSDGKFNADGAVTREQLAAMLFRYADQKYRSLQILKADIDPKHPVLPETEPLEPEGDLSGFRDAHKVSPWAEKAMTWAVEQGIFSGSDRGELDPQDSVTRAQAAAILVRYLDVEAGNRDLYADLIKVKRYH